MGKQIHVDKQEEDKGIDCAPMKGKEASLSLKLMRTSDLEAFPGSARGFNKKLISAPLHGDFIIVDE